MIPHQLTKPPEKPAISPSSAHANKVGITYTKMPLPPDVWDILSVLCGFAGTQGSF